MTVLHRAATPPQGWLRRPGPVALRDARPLTWVPVGAATGLLVLTLASQPVAASLALPIAVVGGLLGLPHGAVDHLLPRWLEIGRPRPGSTPSSRSRLLRESGFVVFYMVSAASASAALILAPTPTLTAFLVLSAAHFGWGEVVTGAERGDRAVHVGPDSLLVALAFGLVTVGLLVWGHPDSTDPYLRAMSPVVADAVGASRGAGVALTLSSVVVALVVLSVQRRTLDAVELALLTAVFVVCPPLAAFGVYFGLWHAVRYSGRLLDLVRADHARGERPDPGWGPACSRLARLSGWPTAAALTGIVAIWVLRDVASLQAVVSVLLAVTFPHAAVVARLDQRQERRHG